MISPYLWTVPATFNGYTINGTDYQIFVEAWDASPNHNANGALSSGYLTLQPVDTTPPTVSAFSVTPTSVTVGSPVTISYTVSDTGGSGLNRVELWRTNTYPTWPNQSQNQNSASGNGPVSGTFVDTPPSAGDWWYGIHVADTAGNWITETQGGWQPIHVTVNAPDTTPPTNVAATDGTYTDEVRVTWTDSVNATAYEVWRNSSNNSGTATKISSSDVAGTSYDDTTATAGTTYWYWIKAKNASGTSGFSAADSRYRATVSGPVNDNFANRTAITDTSATVTGTNVGASKESGEPNHAGISGGKSVWWTWTAPSGGSFQIDTIGSSFDTILGVYTGSSVSSLTTVAGDDDSGGNLTSKVTFNAVGGTSYAIAVDGYSGASGNITLHVILTTININNPPVVDLNGAGGGTGNSSVWVGAGAALISDPTATVTDADGGNLTSIKITLNSPHTGDVLAATTTGSITQSFINNTLTLSGSDSIANYQTVLRSVNYNNTLGGQGVDVETAQVVVNDGTVDGNTAVATINMPPTIILTVGAGSGTPNYTTSWYNNGATGNTGAVPIENMAQATMNSPANVANIASLTVKLATFHTGDVLACRSCRAGALTTTYASGTLVLSGSDTLAHYQQELRFVNYNNTAGGPGTSPVLITFAASDGTVSSTPVTATVNVSVASGQVLGNRLFYNNSKYDNNSTNIAASDDLAIASDKIGYTTGTLSNFSAVSGFNKGITGVMVDLASGIGTHSNINLTSGDITFKISPVTFVTTTFNQLSTWTAAPGAANISVRLGAGVGGSDRLEITWANLKITNTWLEVNVKSDASTGHTNTGLSADDVFYFASVIGNSGTGDTTALSRDDANDFTATGNNIIGVTTPVWNVMDYTKDFKVDANDGTVNTNNVFTLRYIANPTGPFAPDAGPSAAPAASGSSNAAVASGLAAASSGFGSSSSTLGSWLSNRPQIEVSSGAIARFFERLGDKDAPRAREILAVADRVAGALGFEDDLLDRLLKDLDVK